VLCLSHYTIYALMFYPRNEGDIIKPDAFNQLHDVHVCVESNQVRKFIIWKCHTHSTINISRTADSHGLLGGTFKPNFIKISEKFTIHIINTYKSTEHQQPINLKYKFTLISNTSQPDQTILSIENPCNTNKCTIL
jgi:hypothetical protein